MKKRRRKRRRRLIKKEKIMLSVLLLVLILLAAAIGTAACHSRQESPQKEVRAVWLAYVDFKEPVSYTHLGDWTAVGQDR